MDASGYSSAWSPLICGFSEGEMTMTKQLLLICVLGQAALTGKGLAGEINGDDEENTNDQLVLHLVAPPATDPDRKSTRLNSSHQIISYAVFCLKKKNETANINLPTIVHFSTIVDTYADLPA